MVLRDTLGRPIISQRVKYSTAYVSGLNVVFFSTQVNWELFSLGVIAYSSVEQLSSPKLNPITLGDHAECVKKQIKHSSKL